MMAWNPYLLGAMLVLLGVMVFSTADAPSRGGGSRRYSNDDPAAKRLALEALEAIDRAVEHGTLAPVPAEGACTWCEVRPVCGPAAAQHLGRKPQAHLTELLWLRSRP